MRRWNEENAGSFLWEMTNGKVTDFYGVGDIEEMSKSIAIFINAMAEDANIDVKEIMDNINDELGKKKEN
ncbi:hypothetical protein CDLVIII_5502 [Clostridium sp. DL-VIII]|uniref:hypothetical protein n=1 Tax=Clostridium sp. DL-VIII TaxID=641107 RepID=UPI00023B056E|nr:hypothetical protein [Clostridium sp. DL-VIII]EHJ01976.1 hypothetical protein CDLVIII_5502 [Clostridium sp. DL-VIII]